MPKRSRSGVVRQPGAGRRADEGEFGEVDLHRTRRRPGADDEVELEVLHRGIKDFLDRRIEAMDLVDEQDVARLEIGELRGEVAGFGDDRSGGRAEIDAELARHDLGERRLAEAGRPDEQHVVERLAARLGRFDEDLQVLARRLLAGEFGQRLRAKRGIVLGTLFGRDETARRVGHQSTPGAVRPTRAGLRSQAHKASRHGADERRRSRRRRRRLGQARRQFRLKMPDRSKSLLAASTDPRSSCRRDAAIAAIRSAAA